MAIGESEPAHTSPGGPRVLKGPSRGSGQNRGGREGAFQPEERGLQQVAVGLAGNPPLPKEAGPDPPPGLPHMKRASGRLQRSQPVGRVIGSVDKVGGLVAAAGAADAARGGGSSEPVARDERAKACPTPKVGSSPLAQHKPRRPRRRGAPTTGKGREETGDGGGWRIRGAGADAHRGGEQVRGEGKGGGRSAGTRNGEVGRRMASGRVRARPFPRGDATTGGERGDGEKRRRRRRGRGEKTKKRRHETSSGRRRRKNRRRTG